MQAATLTAGRPALRARTNVRARVLAATPLAASTVVGAVLRLWAFDRVSPNPFYDTAVRSMSLSWHNFFFGAFEPGGQVSIDKAPADLWLQVGSVKLFGFSPTATRLPEVVAGILAIVLLYDLVRRLFGRRAGLFAAAALAVLPAAILTAHSDTMDSVMMLLNVLAAWLVVVGARSRKVWPVVAAGAVMGLAFNVKLFEALIVMPALVALAVLALDLPRRRRLLAFGGSLVAFVGVSLGWIVVASLTPLSGRPWPIGSTDGSIWDVVFGYNGLDRLRGSASQAALALDPPGALRFFNGSGHAYATTVGTMLLAALLLGAVATALALGRRRRSGGTDRLALAGAVFLGTWLILGVGLLSGMQRMQPRYLEAVTPAIAAVLGVGLARSVAAARAGQPLARAALVAAVAAAAGGGVLLTRPPVIVVIVAAGAAIGCGFLAARRAWRRPTAALAVLGLVAVLALPAWGAVTVAGQHRSNAGLRVRTTPAPLAALSRFLIAHQGHGRYEVASLTVARSIPLILRDVRPVLMLTSLNALPILDAHRLAELVAAGQVRYALLGGATCRAKSCPPAVLWAKQHSRDVSAAAGQPPGTLYRLTART